MSIKLDKKALENIKNYKYKTHGLTFIERLIMDPFWNLVCKFLPDVCTYPSIYSNVVCDSLFFRHWHLTQ